VVVVGLAGLPDRAPPLLGADLLALGGTDGGADLGVVRVRVLDLVGDGPRIEAATSAAWRAGFDPAEVERRRAGVIDRGRAQTA
jgi:hypothetical protein